MENAEEKKVEQQKPKRRHRYIKLSDAEKAVKHFFLRDGQGFPVGCVATHTDPETKKIFYGLSSVNPLDKNVYDRWQAVKSAVTRVTKYHQGLYKPPQEVEQGKANFARARCGVIEVVQGENPKAKLLAVIARDGDVPSRMRRAAKHEMKAVLERGRLWAEKKAAEAAGN
jgi:hypothetical protein